MVARDPGGIDAGREREGVKPQRDRVADTLSVAGCCVNSEASATSCSASDVSGISSVTAPRALAMTSGLLVRRSQLRVLPSRALAATAKSSSTTSGANSANHAAYLVANTGRLWLRQDRADRAIPGYTSTTGNSASRICRPSISPIGSPAPSFYEK
jgi:hypothetical protein